MNEIEIKPVLKWVGGKRQLLSEISPMIPGEFNKYFEPFVGAGAVIFNLLPSKAVINDLNSELINVYKVIRDNPNELIEQLKEHTNSNSKEYFYKVRELDRQANYDKLSDIYKASRTIYLNKTAYNGLYRVNKSGQFNTPWGRYKNPKILDADNILAMSKYFNESKIEILNVDYKKALTSVSKGDFVYFDPPYLPISSSSAFVSYTADGFGEKEQIELKETCDNLNNQGVKFLLSNSYHPFLLDLYQDYNIKVVEARRSVNSKGHKRGKIREILVRNYG
jgi:hypothetical protein